MMVVVMMDGHKGDDHNGQDCNVFIGIVQAFSLFNFACLSFVSEWTSKSELTVVCF